MKFLYRSVLYVIYLEHDVFRVSRVFMLSNFHRMDVGLASPLSPPALYGSILCVIYLQSFVSFIFSRTSQGFQSFHAFQPIDVGLASSLLLSLSHLSFRCPFSFLKFILLPLFLNENFRVSYSLLFFFKIKQFWYIDNTVGILCFFIHMAIYH